MFDAIGQLFQGLIDFLQPILIPDWRALIDLLPILLLLGVVGPIVSLLALGWFVYVVGKPRSRIPYQPPAPQPAQLVDGQPVYPPGEPYCAFDRLVYPFGETRCATCGRDLAVICPKCSTGRPGAHRHVRHVRARPQDRPRRPGASPGRPTARRRRGGLTARGTNPTPSGVRRIEWSS